MKQQIPLRFKQPWMEHLPTFDSQMLPKEPTTTALPLAFGKLSGIMVSLADWFTAFYRKFQTNRSTGPENASNSPLAMGSSPAT
ncbi:hypothetical protein AVEN_18276-1 [Araneus ventricosus]|uniref:Uncharacterized protein n=1 Tax=Araneus ventricosus TaxID=182803 RepID=A0A4Y2AKJ2_ARAVE|nr:hypothetical protein AVEN_18276-1 [Araneus ventricosus]